MTQEEKELLEVVTAMREENIKNRRFPTFSLLREVRDRIRAESGEKLLKTARKLEESGLLKVGRTINDFYFDIAEPETEPENEESDNETEQGESIWQQA